PITIKFEFSILAGLFHLTFSLSIAINYSVESGSTTQAEAEEFFNLKSYIIQGILFTPVVGTLTTAILALFVKKSK
ncbi:MAG: hypothetical protein AAFN93_22920, partial [Bacteroidota bacterium]